MSLIKVEQAVDGLIYSYLKNIGSRLPAYVILKYLRTRPISRLVVLPCAKPRALDNKPLNPAFQEVDLLAVSTF